MQVTLHLESSGYSVTVSREGLLKMRGSLFAQALETDPEATTINLPNPLVKPKHLDAIAVMSRQEIPPRAGLGANIHAVADYLNWPLLEVVADGLIPHMLEFAPYVNIFRPETYGSVLLWAITEDCFELVQHILQMTETTPLDSQAFILAARNHRPQFVKTLLPRVNPVTSAMSVGTLRIWTHPTDSRVPKSEWDELAITEFLEGKDNQAFRQAIVRMVPVCTYNDHARQTLSLLLSDERIKTTAPLQDALKLAVKTESMVLLRYLLEKTEVDPNFEIQVEPNMRLPLIQAAVKWQFLQSVFALAQCSRVQIAPELRERVKLLDSNSFTHVQRARNLKSLFNIN